MDKHIDDSVVRKIQLLLNLGQHSSANEHEAAIAMAKAQELLAQYNLELHEVQGQKVKGGTAEREPEKREKTKIDRSAMYGWQRELCKAIAEANFCFYWYREYREPYQKRYSWGTDTAHRKVKRHVILGREANVIAVTMMYEYLAETIERILPYSNKERLSRSAISWREGCASRLIERIQAKFEKMQADTAPTGEATTTAIVLQSVIKSEYAANYDAQHGEGAYARHLQYCSEVDARYEERQALAIKQRDELLANETPQARKLREQREAAEAEKQQKRSEKWAEQEERRRQRHWNNRDIEAFYEGRAKGKEISLADQISTTEQDKLK